MYWQIGGGIPVRINDSLDSSPLISCAQTNGTTLQYKVSKVKGLGTYPEICFLLIKQTTLGAYYTPTLITGAFTGCNACEDSSSDISLASSSSISSSTISSPTISSSSDLASSASSIFSSSVTSSSAVSVSSTSQSSSSTSRLPSMTPSDRCGYHHPDKVDITGVYKRDPAYNTNIWITQGDSFCYRFKVFDDGAAVDLSDYNIRAFLKLKISDTGQIETFTTAALSDAGINNIVELTLTAAQTTCLPVTEAIYDVEIQHKTTNKVEKVLIGYFNIKPEVTRHPSGCTASWSLLTSRTVQSSESSTSATSSSSAGPAVTPCPCFSGYLYRVFNGADNTYNFTVEVPTDDVGLKGITAWEAQLYVLDSPRGIATLHETELVDNTVDPGLARGGYEIIFPVGGSRHRFVDKALISSGILRTIFTVPIPASTFVSAYVTIRIFGPNGCGDNGSDPLRIDFDPTLAETIATNCVASSSSSSA